METLDCRINQAQAIEIDDGEVRLRGTTKLQKYTARPVALEGLFFFRFLTLYDCKK